MKQSIQFMLILASGLAGCWGCASTSPGAAETVRCSDSVQTTVNPTRPTVTVSYTEPSINATGTRLQGLAKTTIYYDLGAGRIPAKEVPSSSPSGGGQISQTITVPLRHEQETVVRLCVTATDKHGNESAMTP